MGSKFEQKAKYFSSDVLSTVSIVVAKALYCIMPGILLNLHRYNKSICEIERSTCLNPCYLNRHVASEYVHLSLLLAAKHS